MTVREPLLLDVPLELATARLVLRAPMPGDGPAVHAAWVETWDELHRWLPWATGAAPPTVEECEASARRAHARYLAREDLRIHLWRDGRFVGASGLHRIDWRVPKVEVGYWCRASCQRQGYVTEAVAALADLALGHLGARRVEIRCDATNERSRLVPERLGFALEGRLRNEDVSNSGELRDTLVYARVTT